MRVQSCVVVRGLSHTHFFSLEQAMWRVNAFIDLGADVIFVDALESADEMRMVCDAGKKGGVQVKCIVKLCLTVSLTMTSLCIVFR